MRRRPPPRSPCGGLRTPSRSRSLTTGRALRPAPSPSRPATGCAACGSGPPRWGERWRRGRPQVVLMDIRMPRVDGLEATAQITADPTLCNTRVVVLTTFELDEYVFGALRAGASGFLLKDVEPADLVAAVRVVAGGEALLAPRLTRRLIEAFVAGGRGVGGSS